MKQLSKRPDDFCFTLLRKEDLQKLWNPELQIIFILEGTGKISFLDMKREYLVKERDIFVINSFEPYRFELEGESIALSFLISLEFIASVSPELLKYKINCRSFLQDEDCQEYFDLIRCDLAHVFQNQYKNEKNYVPHMKSKVVAILENLSRYFLDREALVENKNSIEILRDAVNYILYNYKENISLEDLAQKTFLSKTYISRSFKKQLGISFTEYLASVRMSHAIQMLNGNETLAEIAFESGFPNVNAMILIFKKYRGITPGEYRKLQKENQKFPQVQEREEAERDIFFSLMNYINKIEEPSFQNGQVREIVVSLNGRRQKNSSHWRRLMNAGYAKSLVDGAIQSEIRYIQEKIHFDYIRIKGILDDDMCLLRNDMNGNIIMNYAYIDEVIDFILSVKARPMIEIGYMPQILAKKIVYQSMRVGIISVPTEIESWKNLVTLLMKHLVNRYGILNVRTWLFSPWISPDFAEFGECSQEEYEQVYTASYRAIKSVDENILTAGPGSADGGKCLKWFLNMCRKNESIPEVITFRSYATVETQQDESGLKLIVNNESFSMATSGDEDYLKHTVLSLRNIMEEEGVGMLPLVLEEWSNNIWQRDLCNDTCFKSAYLFKNILENNNSISAMGYFTLNDRMDEVAPTTDTFHGGFGLFTKNHIPKSACRAMELLSEMGDKVIQSGDGYFITQKEDEIQIFLYNYCHYDLLYRYRHLVNIGKTNRYNVFESKEQQAFYIQLSDMDVGDYEICRYGITQDGGSSYDIWVKMGAPEPLNIKEQEMLKSLSIPQYYKESVQIKPEERILEIKVNLKPLDVWMIKIKKK